MPVNDSPSFANITDPTPLPGAPSILTEDDPILAGPPITGFLSLNEDFADKVLNIDTIAPGAFETGQSMTLVATSSDTSILPNPTVTYSSPASTGTLVVNPTTGGYLFIPNPTFS